MKIALIGLGIVGSAQARMFRRCELVPYDPKRNKSYPKESIAECDFAIVSVGTPEAEDGSADLTGFWEAVNNLPDELPVLIRSTVPPGTTAIVAESRSGHTAFCPEFMHERQGGLWPESWVVPWLILGGKPDATAWFHNRAFKGRKGVFECAATAAELSKYVANLYWAARVTFVNEMASVSNLLGVPWEDVRRAWLQDERINPAYTAIDGFPAGYGGRCLPKDLSALIAVALELEYTPEYLIAIEDSNERFTGCGGS